MIHRVLLRSCLILAASLLAVGCQPELPVEELPDEESGTHSRGLTTGSVEVGVWYVMTPSYLNQTRMNELSNMGVDVINSDACRFPTVTDCTAYDKSLLSLGAAASPKMVKTWVWDARMWNYLGGSPIPATTLDAIAADYKASPALKGYHLMDEPGRDQTVFNNINAAEDGLKLRDSAHPSWVNLLPSWAVNLHSPTLVSPTPAQVRAGYQAYIDAYVSTVNAPTLTYDNYPFTTAGDWLDSWFENMVIFREKALQHNKKWGQFIQSAQWQGMDKITREEELWSAMHSLAYGAKEIWWFTYWQSSGAGLDMPWAIMSSTGSKFMSSDGLRYHYDDVKAINDKIHKFGKYLGGSTSSSVWHNGPIEGGDYTDTYAASRPVGSPVYIPSQAVLTVGIFNNGTDKLAFLVNRNRSATTTTDVYFKTASGYVPQKLNLSTDTFENMSVLSTDTKGQRVSISLPAGDAALIFLKGTVPTGYAGAEAYVGIVRGSVGALYETDSNAPNAQALRMRDAPWNYCPPGYTNVGTFFDSNGFWVCARNDLAKRSFNVGNTGSGDYYRVVGGNAKRIGNQSWYTCETSSTLVAKNLATDGFWLCMHSHDPEVYVGRVRGNVRHLHVIDTHAWDQEVGTGNWDVCPSGYSLKGNLMDANGFWLCPRSDLLSRTYNVGNVVNNTGNFYRLSPTTSLGTTTWYTCETGRTFLGTFYDPNGMWVCY